MEAYWFFLIPAIFCAVFSGKIDAAYIKSSKGLRYTILALILAAFLLFRILTHLL